MVLEILNGVKGYNALRVRTIYCLDIAKGLNMVLDVLLPAKSIEKLIESLRCRQICLAKTKWAASCVHGRLAEDYKIASKGEGSRCVEVALTMLLPLGRAGNPQIALQA